MITKFHLYFLKGSANVKISMQCFEINAPHLVARLGGTHNQDTNKARKRQKFRQ